MRRGIAFLSFVFALSLAGCSAGGDASPGATNSGGTTGAAGTSSGGATGTAGTTSGGATGAAGTTSGGTTGTAGTAGTAGTTSSGGAIGTGGTAGAGTGGTGTGGTSGTGGTTGGTGGTSGTGGTTGGTGGTGGTATGGTGGVAGTGGSGTGGTETYPVPTTPPSDETGADLWLRYPKVPLPGRLAEYQAALSYIVRAGSSATLQAAQSELVKGIGGLLGVTVTVASQPTGDGAVVLGTPASSTLISGLGLGSRLTSVGSEGYLVEATNVGANAAIVVAGNTDVGVLHGAFALLRHLQTHRTVQGLSLSSAPKIKRRILNHWDNMDGTVERGYAGRSLWNWTALPGTLSQRYTDYARANASIGINGTVLNNVNANAQILTSTNLDKVAALANVFRPYGVAVYLSARFSAPIEIGGLTTADPLNATVKQWWVTKVNEIYQKIPNFGGFLVKANAEGQPGPQQYGRTHADGAKMMSDALAPHGGIVLWRAFVYSDNGQDRIRQAYDEFHPLDGQFGSAAMVQVKNGPLDFQPREPFSPLFGAMPGTPLSLELQVTKEYLGEDTHLAYLGTLYEEVLRSDTYAKGAGSTVARVIDGTVHGYANTAISGVANIGSDTNWCGSHMNQANWYAYGRLAWDPDATAQSIADEWIRQTLSNDPVVVTPVTAMMMSSRQNLVNYMTPLGLAHIMGTNDHYGPAPWINNLSTANWNPYYYHKADATGIGFDRTSTGSNAVSQYFPTVRDMFANKSTIPNDFLLFFQRVGWDDRLASSNRTIWEELVYRYSAGVDSVQTMRDEWTQVQGRIDTKRYTDVGGFLQIQHYEARWWRDACLQYFASVNRKAIPAGYAAPAQNLAFYQNLETKCPADVTKPRCPDVYTGNPSPAITP
jgi:alpha-glucuronidase